MERGSLRCAWMLWRLKLIRIFLVLFVVSSTFLGCSDDDCGGCAIGESCVSGSCEAVPCFGGCVIGQTCIEGVCAVPDDQCAVAGVTCDPTLPIVDGALCVDLDGFGAQPPICADNCEAGGTCDAGSLCFWLASSGDATCASDGECTTGQVCLQGACRETICRPSECEGIVAGLQTCQDLYGGTAGFENGAACAELDNSAKYCFPAGLKGIGESCVGVDVATEIGSFEGACTAGLACVDAICRQPCVDSAACSGDQTCLLASESVAGAGVGFCDVTCTPFEVGSCGAGRTCLALNATDGVCGPAGNIAAFEECDPTLRNCQDGNVCATYQEGVASLGIPAISRCQPVCNITNAPTESDGTVSQVNQGIRDTACPNPPAVPADFWITYVGTRAATIDVYVDGNLTAPALAAGDRTAMSYSVPGGQAVIRVLRAGAPATDPALVESSVSFVAGKSLEVVLHDEPLVSDSLLAVSRRQTIDAQTAEVLNLGDAIDLIAVPTGDDLSVPNNQIELLSGTTTGADLPLGDWDLLAFAPGTPRNDRFLALAELNGVAVSEDIVIYVSGTAVDSDDLPPALHVFSKISDPVNASDLPRYTCVPLGNEAYGACRQTCGSGSEGYGGGCLGASMGCGPDFVSGPDVWGNLCVPLGDAQPGQSCVPLATYGSCAEGLHCSEVGSTSPGFDPIKRGRCESLCVLGDPANGTLECEPDQSCRALSYDGFEMGECATACNATRFTDPICPAGQAACLPVASLKVSGADGMTVITQEEPSFCSVAGDIPIGAPCGSSDCVATAECLFPRSSQTGFGTSLLSQYVGGPGLESVCTPRCNPFDATAADTPCGAGQTCLFNFPYNADVGSCAPIVETATVNGPCTRPGESCGPDSICAVDGGSNVCYRFCQFTGRAVDGNYERSTCPSPLVCSPLVNDLGICLPL